MFARLRKRKAPSNICNDNKENNSGCQCRCQCDENNIHSQYYEDNAFVRNLLKEISEEQCMNDSIEKLKLDIRELEEMQANKVAIRTQKCRAYYKKNRLFL
jgi:hypothetical protein